MTKNNSLAGKAAVWMLCTILASACTDNITDGAEPLPEGKYPLEFTSQMYGMEVTRATPDNTWSGSEKIALKVGNDVKQYAADSQGKITADAGVTPFYWTSTTETKNVSAYYPYSLATASVITVKTSQNNADDYQASDALYAASTSIAFNAAEKKLTFKHLPAKVVANLKAGDGVTAAEVQGATVKFVSQSLTASFNSSTGAVTAAQPGNSSVVPNVLTSPASGSNKSVQALLVPCQMHNKQFIEVTIGNDKFRYTPTTTTDGLLESGKAYTYEITVKRDGIEVKLTESGEWGDGGNQEVQSRSLSMKFTIDLTSYSDKTYILPFSTSSSNSTGNYTLTVDWGDGSAKETINPNTSLSTPISHTYANAQEYTITISTNQPDFSKEQIPDFKPGNYNNTNNNAKKLKSFLTPLLNTDETNFSSSFYGCSSLTSIPAGLFDNNPQASNFTNCFNNCSSLTGPIPLGLFDNNPKVTLFGACFSNCSNLTGPIPAGLFDNNPLVTTFSNCFSNCEKLTGSIPAGLFDNNPLVTDFLGCFTGCSGLTSIPTGLFDENTKVTTFANCFYGCSGLTSIPAKLFDNNPEVKTFKYCFRECSNLSGSIPPGLFDKNEKVTTFTCCFLNCSSLTGSIPAKLFANNPVVINFSGCFSSCSKLTMNANIFCDESTEKDTRFLGKTVDFSTCFSGVGSDTSVSGSAGTAPALWSYKGTLTPTTACFKNIGSVTNASEILDAWKK